MTLFPSSMPIGDLLRHLVRYAELPPRTAALQQMTRIGTGFHRKWYRSQKEHWLGNLGSRVRAEALAGRDFLTTPVLAQWNRLRCFPMLSWVAKNASADPDLLDQAKNLARIAAECVNLDHPSHGCATSIVLTWRTVEAKLQAVAPLPDHETAAEEVRVACERLAGKKSAYRIAMGAA